MTSPTFRTLPIAVAALLFTFWSFSPSASLGDDIGFLRGGLQRQLYTNLLGGQISDLTNSAKFPDQPDFTNIVTSFETPSQTGEMYGERLTGYLLPPVSGHYTFYVSSDDQGAFYLSTNMSPAGKALIAWEPTWSFPRSWTGTGGGRTNSANISLPVYLDGGRAYYVEALHKEFAGGDNFGVAWQIPGGLPPENGSDPITGEFLAYGFYTNYTPRVSLVHPSEGATFSAPAEIVLGANAVVLSNRVKEVRFYEGTNFIGRTEHGAVTPIGAYLVTWSNVMAGSYTLTAQVTDSIGMTGTSAPVHITVTNSAPPPLLILGSLLRQVYTNIPAITVAALTNTPKFPDAPDLVTALPLFEAPSNFADNYGQRISGFILPPVTGDYIFYIASDDQSMLFLSTDATPANKRLIAFESAWRPPRMWLEPGIGGGAHISLPIHLESGRAYYVEALHQEGGGGDNLAVAWQAPGDLPPADGSAPIPGEYLAHMGGSPPNLPPTCAIGSPVDGAVFVGPKSIRLMARASDPDGTVSSVEFFANGRSLGSGRRSDSTFLLDWMNPAAGVFTLFAKATDDLGASVASAPVHITIRPPEPPPSDLIDLSFNPLVEGTPSFADGVNSIALQPDNKILIGGHFDKVNSAARRRLARLNPDGSLDQSFKWPLEQFYPEAIVIQPDGKILVGGSGLDQNGKYVPVLRLNSDGSLDLSFSCYASATNHLRLTALALQPDGRILANYIGCCGADGNGTNILTRLNSDGSVDPSFQTFVTYQVDDDTVNTLAMQPDGKILIGGYLLAYDVPIPRHLARLNSDGSVDGSFKTDIDSAVYSIAVQRDGRVVASGAFTSAGGFPRNGIARFNPDGTLDTGFEVTEWADGRAYITALALQPDGRVLMGGIRYSPDLDYADAQFVVRLSAQGKIDPNYLVRFPGPEINSSQFQVDTIVLQPDLRVLVGGQFLNAGGIPRTHLVRLLNDAVVAPVITSQPVSQRRYTGQGTSFTVKANGTAPLSYAWRHNGILIPGASKESYLIANTILSDAGEYVVTVTNSAGWVESTTATLDVTPIPDRFLPSVSIPMNCAGGGFGSSNYKLADLGSDPSELHVIGVHEGAAHVNGMVSVTVHPTAKPVVLVLSAYQPVIWNLSLDAQARLSAVYLSSLYHEQTVVGVPDGVPILRMNFGAYAYGWEPNRNEGGGSYTTLIRNIRSMTGLVENSFQGCYAGNAFEIPYSTPPNSPPVAVCGASRTVIAYSPEGVLTGLNASVSDVDGDAMTVIWTVDGVSRATNNLPLGPTGPQAVSFENWFPVGSHDITLSVTDGRGESVSCVMVLTVTYSPQPNLVVTSSADSGPGTLRDIIAGATSGATITFGISGVISLTSGELVIDKPLNVHGPGAQTLAIRRADSASAFRLLNVTARGVKVSGLTLQNGLVSQGSDYDDGAAILNRGGLILRQCVVAGNEAVGEYSRGGAACNQWGAALEVLGCTFVDNAASGYYGEGGAIYNYGRLAITNSTFSGNSVGGWGGAVHNDMLSQGSVIDSCTFTANTAKDGGAVFNRGAPPQNVSPVLLRNSILVGNTADDLSHCSLILSGGYNLVGRVTDPYGSLALPIVWGPGDRTGVSPAQVLLGPLQLNGGTTLTHALLRHSIALDAGPESGGPETDQRGQARPFGPRYDIGAFESEALFTNTAPEIVCGQPVRWQSTSVQGATGTLTTWVKDTDGDPLVVTWMIDGNPCQTNNLAAGAVTPVAITMTATLGPGNHAVVVSVSDGIGPLVSCLTSVEVMPLVSSWAVRAITGNSVSISATPPANTGAWALEEQPPKNWAIVNISGGGLFDRATGKVKFGPYFDSQPRRLGYTAYPPLGFIGIALVNGIVSADGRSVPVTGDDRIVVVSTHPADLTPADWVLRMDEVTAYAAAWRSGAVWDTPPNPIPMDYVTRASSLWQGGETYTVDPTQTSAPLWWVNTPHPVRQGIDGKVSGTLIRDVIAGYVPGASLDVSLNVAAPLDTRSFAVQESVPAEWRVDRISHGGQFDSVNRQIKWGPFLDSAERTLSFQLTPPANARGPVSLAGSGSFDGISIPTAGSSRLDSSSSLHWVAEPAKGKWGLLLQGELGARYLIENSVDLVNWSPVATVTNTLGTVAIPGSAMPQAQRQYFRAKMLP